MSIYERQFEFGVLAALGTSPRSLGLLVMAEGGWLALLSALPGALLGACLGWWYGYVGIDYSGSEFAGVTILELIRPELHPRQFVLYPLALVAITLLASAYPALHVARRPPAETMRRGL